MSTSSSVWDRRGTNVLPKNLYMFLVCFWTAFGIASSAVAASLNQAAEFSSRHMQIVTNLSC
jgi:hypothetical protein